MWRHSLLITLSYAARICVAASSLEIPPTPVASPDMATLRIGGFLEELYSKTDTRIPSIARHDGITSQVKQIT
jgi:hypothetical protein